MNEIVERTAALNKSNVEALLNAANVVVEGVERVLDLQFQAARGGIADALESVKALTSVKDMQDLVNLQASLAQPALEKATSYSRSVYAVVSETQAELAKIAEARVAELNRVVMVALDDAARTAPAGSNAAVSAVKSAVVAANSAYDTIAKAAKQVVEMTEASVAAATENAAQATVGAARKVRAAAE